MSAMLWKIGDEEDLRRHVINMDARFQVAMRQELATLAAERGLKLAPTKGAGTLKEAPQAALSKPRDKISIGPIPKVQPILNESQKIMREICEKHGISKAELLSPRRSVPIVTARHEAMYRMSKETSMSLPAIGQRLGGRDHTTVIHGIRKYEANLRGERYVRPSYGQAEAGL